MEQTLKGRRIIKDFCRQTIVETGGSNENFIPVF
jgi:hypothetical protein